MQAFPFSVLMSKILIKDLLNQKISPGESKEIKVVLQSIRKFLLNLTSVSPITFYQDTVNVQIKLRDIVIELTRLRGNLHERNLKVDVVGIYELAIILIETINKFPYMDIMLKSKKLKKNKEQLFIVNKFDIVSKEMLRNNISATTPFRGHRFSKDSVVVLENWYTEHYHKPYFSKKQLNKLQKCTGLTAVQLRNWLSNRRRKEKAEQVSSIVLNYMNEQ